MRPLSLGLLAALALGLGAAASTTSPAASGAAPAATAPAAAAPAAAPAAKAAAKTAAHTLVLCAPGYPGNTVQAQPAMDALARAIEKTAGLPAGEIGAVYHETEVGGIERLRAPDAAIAMTTLPFFLADGPKAGLVPRLTAVRNGSATQFWSLIAKRGRVGDAADLDGWELTGSAGYAPDFVRVLLQGWGPLRSTTKITFSPAPLGALKRVVDGEDLAVLLEPEQVQAIFPKHPFAKDLEIVATSKPVPGSIVSVVPGRMDEARVGKILDALQRLPSSPEGAEALKTLRIERFATLDPKSIGWMQRPAVAPVRK